MIKDFSRKIINTLNKNSINRLFSKKEDYYSILGVPKTATQTEIKKAFAKLAREFHPDKNHAPDAKEKFSKITEAYSTLSDEQKREVYNQTGMTGDEQKQYQNSGFDPNGAGFDFNDFFRQSGGQGGFEDIFKEFGNMFGGGSKSVRPSRGADIIVSLEIDFFEAINGCNKEVNYRVQDICGTCNGNKCKPGTSVEKCFTCSGTGTQTLRQGNFHIQTPCQSCQGEGTKIKNPCTLCKGTGIAGKNQKEKLTVPKGVNNAQSLRISGKGNKGEHGGPQGDLIVKLTVKQDNYYRREGYDIYTDISITIAQAVLGSVIEVRCLNGIKKVNIPTGTNSGKKIRLPNEGVTKLPPNHNQKGDHYIILNISIPSKLSDNERKIFEKLKEIEENNNENINQYSENKQNNDTNEENGFLKNLFKGNN